MPGVSAAAALPADLPTLHTRLLPPFLSTACPRWGWTRSLLLLSGFGSTLSKTLPWKVEPDLCSSVAMVTRREIISCAVSSDRFCRMQGEIRRLWCCSARLVGTHGSRSDLVCGATVCLLSLGARTELINSQQRSLSWFIAFTYSLRNAGLHHKRSGSLGTRV